MNEEKIPFPIVSRENIKPFIVEFEDKQIFNEIASLLDNDKEALKELRYKIAENLDRMIIANLKSAFDASANGDNFLEFMVDLTELRSGEEQIHKIGQKLQGGKLFWGLIESQLKKDFLDPMIKALGGSKE